MGSTRDIQAAIDAAAGAVGQPQPNIIIGPPSMLGHPRQVGEILIAGGEVVVNIDDGPEDDAD